MRARGRLCVIKSGLVLKLYLERSGVGVRLLDVRPDSRPRQQLIGKKLGGLKKNAAKKDLGNADWKSTISCSEDCGKVS